MLWKQRRRNFVDYIINKKSYKLGRASRNALTFIRIRILQSFQRSSSFRRNFRAFMSLLERYSTASTRNGKLKATGHKRMRTFLFSRFSKVAKMWGKIYDVLFPAKRKYHPVVNRFPKRDVFLMQFAGAPSFAWWVSSCFTKYLSLWMFFGNFRSVEISRWLFCLVRKFK